MNKLHFIFLKTTLILNKYPLIFNLIFVMTITLLSQSNAYCAENYSTLYEDMHNQGPLDVVYDGKGDTFIMIRLE